MPFAITAELVAETLGDDQLLVTKRTHNRVIRDVYRRVLLLHWQKRLPEHFLRSAFTKYPQTYEPRSVKYERQKAKRFGTSRPNVKTRATRRAVLGNTPRITATGKRATMRIRLPFKGGTGRFRKAGGSFRKIAQQQTIRDRIEELEVINRTETREMLGEIKDEYLRIINRRGGKLRRIRTR